MKSQMPRIASAFLAAAVAAAASAAPSLDTAKVDQLTGLKGALNKKEGVYKVSLPRADLKITVDNWQMPPFMGLTSWAAFQPGMKNNAMVMGDLVLMQDEVNPVMSAALDNGLEVTALHNHFLFDEPKVYFMHIGGEGSVEQLATGVRHAFDKVKEIRAGSPQPATSFAVGALPTESSISPKPLETILGVTGQTNSGMFKAVFGRTAKMPCGCEAGKEMGVNTWAAFAGADDNALVDGDFAMTEDELQTVLKTLRAGGVNIVAIHNHMTGETPRYIFLHYWGRGPAASLARSLKKALDAQHRP
ncbi:MAG TPA: DUF1259 domain-containing protein [Candidatus Acidoferrum sp.]|jgi:hypothetical protein|nr:DUF1259 domain-containing protein [Candidatus Acidoferrum sp.]